MTLAKLIYVTNVSLDGYIEDAHGSFEWTVPTNEVFTFITDLVRPVGTYLYGRRMYETMAVWEADPPWPPSRRSGPTSRASGKRPTSATSSFVRCSSVKASPPSPATPASGWSCWSSTGSVTVSCTSATAPRAEPPDGSAPVGFASTIHTGAEWVDLGCHCTNQASWLVMGTHLVVG